MFTPLKKSQFVSRATFLWLLSTLNAAGASKPPSTNPVNIEGAYCGLYAVYGALHVLGVKTHFEELLKSQYLNSDLGSTLGELQQALADHNTPSLAVRNLDAKALSSVTCPMILHVRSSENSLDYDHWVLRCLDKNGRIKVIDGDRTQDAVTPSNLIARWDHTSILVSPDPQDLSNIRTAAGMDFLVIALIGFAAILTLRTLVGKSIAFENQNSRFLGGLAVTSIAFISVLASLLHAAASDLSLLRQWPSINALQIAHCADFVRHVSIRSVEAAAKSHDSIILDARRV